MVETQTALARFAHEVHLNWSFSHSWSLSNMTTDETVRYTRDKLPGTFDLVLQDPRYIAYCKEQDTQDYIQSVCDDAGAWMDR